MSQPSDSRQGFTVTLFFPNGDPDGIKEIRKFNWSGYGLVIPRNTYEIERKKERLTTLGAGVYFLVGSDEKPSLPKIYIGEGDSVADRLYAHANHKDFWTHAVIFTSNDGNLNKAHVQYLESRLIDLAQKAKKSTLDNENNPTLPSLSKADIADCEGFLENILLCLPILGYPFFDMVDSSRKVSQDFFIESESKGILAQGYETSGGFAVTKGSHATKEEAPSMYDNGRMMRQALIDKKVLVPAGTSYQFSQDYEFSSPSMAAGVILGRPANGRTEWKTKDRKTLKMVQEEGLGVKEA